MSEEHGSGSSVGVSWLKKWGLPYLIPGILLLASLSSAWAVRDRLPAEPLMWPDSFTYLSPGITMEAVGHWNATARKFGYPLFLYVVSSVSGRSDAVVAVQHALGLGAGLALALTWGMLLRSLLLPWPLRTIAGLLGVAIVHAYWHSPIVLLYESFLMPEGLFLSLSAFAICSWTWTVMRLLAVPGGAKLTLPFVWSFFLSALLYFLVPRWGFGAVFLPLGLLLIAWRLDVPRQALLKPVLLATALSGLLLLVPDRLLSRRSDAAAAIFVDMHLFGMHVHLIAPELRREAAEDHPRHDRTFLLAAAESIDREIARCQAGPANNGPYPSLGFSPEEIIYGDSTLALAQRHFGQNQEELGRFLRHYYFAVWQHQPGAMLRKIARELGYYYSWPGNGLPRAVIQYPSTPLVEQSAVLAEAPGTHAMLQGAAAWQAYSVRARAQPPGGDIVHGTVAFEIDRGFSLTLVPLVLAGGIFGATALVRARHRDGALAPARGLWLTAGLLILPAFGMNLSVAVLHSLYPSRYLENGYTFSLMSGGVAALALLHLFFNLSCSLRRAHKANP
jgi:hypothetical protein